MSTKQDMELPYLADWLVDFEILDTLGSVVDISGATIEFRVSTLGGTTVMTRTEADGVTITDAASGACSLRVTPTHQTNASVDQSTSYQWELRVTTSGLVGEHGHGQISVRQSILAA